MVTRSCYLFVNSREPSGGATIMTHRCLGKGPKGQLIHFRPLIARETPSLAMLIQLQGSQGCGKHRQSFKNFSSAQMNLLKRRTKVMNVIRRGPGWEWRVWRDLVFKVISLVGVFA